MKNGKALKKIISALICTVLWVVCVLPAAGSMALPGPEPVDGIPFLTIVVGYTNIDYSKDADWHQILFENDDSLARYYDEQSGGALHYTPAAAETSAFGTDDNDNTWDRAGDGIVHVRSSIAHGSWSDVRSSLFSDIPDVLSKTVPYVDYSRYDTDHDGILTSDELTVLFIIAGYGIESVGTPPEYILRAFFTSGSFPVGSWEIQGGSFVNEYQSAGVPEGSPTFCHEFGHRLGLTDYYDTKMASGAWQNYQVGHMSPMNTPSFADPKTESEILTPLDAFSKTAAGWYEAETAVQGENVLHSRSSGEYNILLIKTGGADEFYLEYVPAGLAAAYYPDSCSNGDGGVVIWHLDRDVYRYYYDSDSINVSTHRPGLMPVFMEYDDSGAPTTIGNSVDSHYCFFRSEDWAGQEIRLPLYDPCAFGSINDIPGKRSFSDITLTIGPSSPDDDQITVTVNYPDLANAEIAQIPDARYTGLPVRPVPEVTYKGKALSAPDDYTLTYENNIEEGAASVTVTGNGGFTGTQTVPFNIVKWDDDHIPTAVVSDGGRLVTFYYDDRDHSEEGTVYILDDGSSYKRPWAGSSLRKAVFDESFQDYTGLRVMDYWFSEDDPETGGTVSCPNLSEISGLEYVNTSEVTSMEGMFMSCSSLESIDLSVLDTSSVKNMVGLFYDCAGLKHISLAGLDTSSVTDMSLMFSFCTSLISADLSGLDISRTETMEEMFCSCESLQSVDLSGTDTSSVTNMYRMFRGCEALEEIDLSALDTSAVTDMGQMFYYCLSLETADLSCLDLSSVESMSEMFAVCLACKNINMSGVTAPELLDMSEMFYSCSSLESVDMSGFCAPKAVTMANMFENCVSLNDVNVTGLNIPGMKDMSFCFTGCSALGSVDFSEVKAMTAGDMSYLFQDCQALESADLSGIDMSGTASFLRLFSRCFKLKTVDMTQWDLSSAEEISLMFSFCTSLETVYAAPGTDLSELECTNLFYSCTSLQGGNGTAFSEDHIHGEYARIDGLDGKPGYFTQKTGIADTETAGIEDRP